MLNLNNLKSVKKKLESRDKERSDTASRTYLEAIEYLEQFSKSKNYDRELLHQAALKIIQTLKQQGSKPEPYLCLTYIFYVIGETKLAIKYNNLAAELDPNSPLVEEMRQILSRADEANLPKRRITPVSQMGNEPTPTQSTEKRSIQKIKRIERLGK